MLAKCVHFHLQLAVITMYMQWMIKVKPHLCVEQLIVSDLVVCGASYQTRAALSCDMRPHKQMRSDKSSCSTHSCGFPVLSWFRCVWMHLFSICNINGIHIIYRTNTISWVCNWCRRCREIPTMFCKVTLKWNLQVEPLLWNVLQIFQNSDVTLTFWSKTYHSLLYRLYIPLFGSWMY